MSVQSIIGATANFLYFSIIYPQALNHIEIGQADITGPYDMCLIHSVFQSVTINSHSTPLFLLMALTIPDVHSVLRAACLRPSTATTAHPLVQYDQ
jgi:hypothetical protein